MRAKLSMVRMVYNRRLHSMNVVNPEKLKGKGSLTLLAHAQNPLFRVLLKSQEDVNKELEVIAT